MTTQLEDALALALKLAPKERLQLIELIASSVESELEVTLHREEASEVHWGQSLIRLLDEVGPIEMRYPEIEDPVEWVKHLRSESRKRRLGNWGDIE